MPIETLKALISQTLDPWKPGIELQLRSPVNTGFDSLRTLLNLLSYSREATLLVGYYRFGGDSVPEIFLGAPIDSLPLAPDSELDWNLWVITTEELDVLAEHISWPELIVDGEGRWLLWTEDNRSFLYSLPL